MGQVVPLWFQTFLQAELSELLMPLTYRTRLAIGRPISSTRQALDLEVRRSLTEAPESPEITNSEIMDKHMPLGSVRAGLPS
jgi:hypothetical protein